MARLPLGTVSTTGRLEDLLLIMMHYWEKLTVESPTVWSKSKASYEEFCWWDTGKHHLKCS